VKEQNKFKGEPRTAIDFFSAVGSKPFQSTMLPVFRRGLCRPTMRPTRRAFHASRALAKENRVSNFNAGPAGVPLPVLESAHKDFFNYQGSGMSVMELSHRSKQFDDIIVTAEQDLRDLLNVSDDYAVTFMQGGASTQFAAVPLNFLGEQADASAEYLVTGAWSKGAAKEAKKYSPNADVIVNTADDNHTSIPDPATWARRGDNPRYLHYCANETVHGVEFPFVPPVAQGQALIGHNKHPLALVSHSPRQVTFLPPSARVPSTCRNSA
jgi:hypothetical protein